MNRKLIALAVLGTLAAGVALPALADDGWRGPGRHHGRAMMGDDRGFERGAMFGRMDEDGDRKVSRDEFLAGTGKRFEDLDADKNGVVSTEEVDAMIAKRIETMRERMMSRFDADKDGSVTREEYDAHHAERFARMDRDDDGVMEPREMMRGHHGDRGGRGDGPRGNCDRRGPQRMMDNN